MEHILYIILLSAGDAGASVDSQRYQSLEACEAASKVVSAALRDQADFFNQQGIEIAPPNLQVRCVPTGLSVSEDE